MRALHRRSEESAVVLVVDDDPASLKLARAVLDHHGFTTVAAASGEDAIEQATAHSPDIGVLDINLPGIDGVELLQRLRGLDSMASMPAIAVTAFAMPADKRHLLTAGFDRHLPKPIDSARLVAEVSELLDSR